MEIKIAGGLVINIPEGYEIVSIKNVPIYTGMLAGWMLDQTFAQMGV